ncbi:cation transporter [Vibrio hippocampi]|uniref:Cation transporter n=1 Tax=Vibrio hippocampi TaxID=654686 RepID=A0ABN8DJC1_9VIBR|nr:cation transporter [Vibrio hippocampi]CAH0526037.1 hypothetical protein VHP8226_01523 [Vibrio hippocampi]
MKRDCFGICLDKNVLRKNQHATFTHVRGYSVQTSLTPTDSHEELLVSFSSPQMSGLDVLKQMKQAKDLVWRAGFVCPETH